MSENPENDIPPDRLSVNPRSDFFDSAKLQRGIGIRFKDRVRTDIEEYCISEGWIRVAAGRSRDRHGNPMTIKLKGEVQPYFENSDQARDEGEASEG